MSLDKRIELTLTDQIYDAFRVIPQHGGGTGHPYVEVQSDEEKISVFVRDRRESRTLDVHWGGKVVLSTHNSRHRLHTVTTVWPDGNVQKSVEDWDSARGLCGATRDAPLEPRLARERILTLVGAVMPLVSRM